MTVRAGVAVALVAVWALGSTVGARAQGEIPEFGKLRTPESPAFVILGISPAQIHRPTSPSTFAMAFLKGFGEEGGDLPASFALETAPYWWTHHPELTLDEYARPGPRSLVQNLSVSFAVTGGDRGADPDDRRVGLGLRTSLFPGETISRDCVEELNTLATRLSIEIGGEVARLIAKRPGLARDPVELERIQETLLEERRPVLERATQACIETLSARRGFVLDLAAAAGIAFPRGEFEEADASRWGAWITPGYQDVHFSVSGVLRVSRTDREEESDGTEYDLGVRAVYAKDRFATSLETVYRRADVERDEDRYRIVGIFDLELFDETWFSVSFGRDYEGDEPGSLVALANVQWNVGDRKVQPIPIP